MVASSINSTLIPSMVDGDEQIASVKPPLTFSTISSVAAEGVVGTRLDPGVGVIPSSKRGRKSTRGTLPGGAKPRGRPPKYPRHCPEGNLPPDFPANISISNSSMLSLRLIILSAGLLLIPA